MTNPESVRVAILAKAPVPGFAKTRLIPALGETGAAELQAQFIRATVATALEAAIGSVNLWCAPDAAHPLFEELARTYPIHLHTQPDADLGVRMLRAVDAGSGPVLVIGTDCPAFTPANLRAAAVALAGGADVVLTPAEDGGYVLIGLREARGELFHDMEWSTPGVAAETVRRAQAAGLSVTTMPTLWDVDEPADLARLIASEEAEQA